MLIFVYAVLVFLVLRFCVTLFNFLSNPKLGYHGKHFSDKVSVIILSSRPAHREDLLLSIEQQDYEFREVIIQHNESIKELVNQATGKYLLFLGAGTTIKYGLINNLIYRTKVFNLAVLSLIPSYRLNGFMEYCIYPLDNFLLLNLFPLRLIRLSSNPAFAAGSSECLFFDAAVYRQHNWHEKVEHEFSNASELVKIVKQHQLNAEVLLANKLMYSKANSDNLEHFGRQLLMNFGNNRLVALIYLLLVICGPLLVLIDFNPVLSILPFGLIFLSRLMIAFLTSQNPILQVLIHPLQMIMLFFLMFKSICKGTLMSIGRKR